MPDTAVLLFTADLRVHDSPALAAAAGAERVVPLYVDDPGRRSNPNRRRFLLDALDDLRVSLRELGGDLAVRRGSTVEQVLAVAAATGATSVVCGSDVGRFETDLRERLAAACEGAGLAWTATAGPSVVAPGRLLPSGGGDHYKVFTPYWRAWSQARWREEAAEPARLRVPEQFLASDPLPTGAVEADLPCGGERAGLARLDAWEADLTALEAWRTATTGVDIVDAGMRQLRAEGWMPNRARLICAGYLTRTLGLDWREGADWFARHLVDLDEANNWGNWQWTAGTGNDTRPNRGFNHERQAARFDPDGAYRRRWGRP